MVVLGGGMPTGGARPLRVLKAISHIRHIAFWEAVSFPAARRYPPAPPPSPLPHLLPSPPSHFFLAENCHPPHHRHSRFHIRSVPIPFRRCHSDLF